MVGRSKKTTRRKSNFSVRRAGLCARPCHLVELIDDIDAAVRAREKPERITDMLKIVRKLAKAHMQGQNALSQGIRPCTCGQLRDWPLRFPETTAESEGHEASLARFAGLTVRERDVLELIVKGYSNKETAKTLGIGQRTVESHRASVMKKVGARSLPELIRLTIISSFGDS